MKEIARLHNAAVATAQTFDNQEFENFQIVVRGQFAETLAAKLDNGEYFLPRLKDDKKLWDAAFLAGQRSKEGR